MMKIHLSALLLGALLAAPALSQDLNISKVAGGGDYAHYGSSNGITAYSMAGTSCNVGSVEIIWDDTIDQAPVIAQNMFKITPEGQFYQLGYSWLKEGFCAISEPTCGSCQATPCDTLGIGCADTYTSSLNDGAGGVAKWQINPTIGAWPASWQGPSGPLPLRGRLQVPTEELQDNNATYIAEIQYLSEEDHAAGNARNNVSWREFRFQSLSNLNNVGATRVNDPALYAWKAEYPDVQIDELFVANEGGAGIHGYLMVGSKATDLGGGMYRYDYVVHNLNTDRSIGSFGLNSPCNISEVTFRSVDHHSGSPWGNEPWAFSNTAGALLWQTEPSSQNPNANAIRWGMSNSFSFIADASPISGTADVGLFKAGSPASLVASVIMPGNDCCVGGSISSYCSANPNSASALGANLTATGTPDIDSNNLSFLVTQLPPNKLGYFLMSQSQSFVPNFSGSQGNLCVGAPIIRFNQSVLSSGPFGFMIFDVDFNNLPGPTTFQAGESWNFQMWYRDNNPGSTSNTSAGINVTFCQ